MTHILSGQVYINGKDIWTNYGAFLREERRGGRENLNALLTPAKTKDNVAVDIREQNGEKYSQDLDPKSEGRDITLHFAIYAATAEQFISRYRAFIGMLKTGNNGWLVMEFPTLSLAMDVFYKECPGGFSALSNLWIASEQCGSFKVTFREPIPSF